MKSINRIEASFVLAAFEMSGERDLRISKEAFDDLPQGFAETKLGDARGAQRQYRSRSGTLHMREYDDSFTVHIDRADPRKNPLAHLALDSPETILAPIVAALIAQNRMKRLGSREKSTLKSEGFLHFAISFFFLNAFFRNIKHILLDLLF